MRRGAKPVREEQSLRKHRKVPAMAFVRRPLQILLVHTTVHTLGVVLGSQHTPYKHYVNTGDWGGTSSSERAGIARWPWVGSCRRLWSLPTSTRTTYLDDLDAFWHASPWAQHGVDGGLDGSGNRVTLRTVVPTRRRRQPQHRYCHLLTYRVSVRSMSTTWHHGTRYQTRRRYAD
ncbi:hypothetical protein F4808DRAFT_187955 [Astrocystis sublimbata]|nr:hypothetical protein F4808DRAFT_187955 [Astrocystis sublimbata]